MVLWKQRKSPHNSPLRRQNYQVSAFLIQKKGQFVCDVKYLPYLCTRKTERYLFATPFGALVQLVRIHACHAWGHGFESRTHRKREAQTGFSFFVPPRCFFHPCYLICFIMAHPINQGGLSIKFRKSEKKEPDIG